MSKQVEHVVVEMQFNNAQFEKGTKETMSTLDKLKEKLKFESIQNGLSKVSAEVKKVDMSPLSNAVEQTSTKFTMLEAIALGALTNIGSAISNKLMNVLREFTIAPIMDGFSEYELKMNSVQTIMSGTGENIDVVNGYLNELNEYADKTIYSFSDMTSSIAKFTNAGVKLPDAVAAIKGVSNAAALAGATTENASSAMYNFSQALSAGYMGLVDWNSIANTAGMGTLSFKQNLIDTAVELGTLIKTEEGYYSTTTNLLGKSSQLFDADREFSANLQYRWMTTDVITKTLAKYSDETSELGQKATEAAQSVRTFTGMMDALKEAVGSGWASTWEILIGNLDEAKNFWTPISNALGNIINGMSDFRNNLLRSWKDLGGRDNLIDGLARAFTNLGKVFTSVGDAFKKVFPEFTGEHLKKITDGFVKLLDSLALGDETIKGIGKAFEVLFTIIKNVGTVIVAPFKVAMPIIVDLIGKVRDVFEFLAPHINKVTDKLNGFLTSSDGASKYVEKLITALQNAGNKAKQFIRDFDMEKLNEYVKMMEPYVNKAKDTLIEMGNKAKEVALKVAKSFQDMDWAAAKSKLVTTVHTITDKVEVVFLEMKERITNTFNNIKEFIMGIPWGEIVKFITGVGIGKIMLDIASFLKGIGKALENSTGMFGGIAELVESVKGILDGVGESLEAFQNRLKAEALKTLAIAIGVLTASIWALSTIDPTSLGIALAAIAALMSGLVGMSVAINKWGGEMSGLVGAAVAIGILAAAIKTLADIDTAKMLIGLGGVVALIVAIAGYNVIMKKYADDLSYNALSIVAFAAAIKILASAVNDISNLNTDQIIRSVSALSALILVFGKAQKSIPQSDSNCITGALNMVAFATAILILGQTVEQLSDLSWEELGKGLTGVIALLAGFVGYALAMNKIEGQVMKASTGLLILSVALTAMLVPLKILAVMSWETIGLGLGRMAMLLVTLAAALQLMPKKHMTDIGLGLLEISVAMTIMYAAIKMMASMSWEEIGRGLTVLGVSLLELAIAIRLMKGCYTGASALIGIASGITILAAAMHIFAAIDPERITSSLLALGGAMVILIGTVAGLSLFSSSLLVVSAAMLSFGAAVALIGAGILAVASSIALLQTNLGGIALVLGALLAAIIKFAPQICEALTAMLLAALRSLRDVVPELVDTLMDILVRVTNSLANNIGPLVDNIVQIILSVVNAVRKHIPAIADAGIGLVVELMASITNKLKSIDLSTMLDAVIGAGIFTAFLAALTVMSPFLPIAMKALLEFGVIIFEFIAILAIIGGIAQIPGVAGIIEDGGGILGKLGDILGNFVGSIISGFGKGLASGLPEIGQKLSDFANNAKPFFETINNLNDNFVQKMGIMVGGISTLSSIGLMDSVLSLFTGSSSLVKMGKQLNEFAPYFTGFVKEISSVASNKVVDAAEAMKNLGKIANDLPREGGLWGLLAGDRDYAKFGKQLKDLGKGLADYSAAVTNVNPGKVKTSVEAARHLADLAHAIPNSGGVAGFFAGENDMSEFAQQLVPFGKGLAEYSNAVTNVNKAKVKESADAAMALATMAHEMPNEGGLVSWFTGDNELDDFGKQLTVFGYGLSSYSKSVAGINCNKIKESVDATLSIARMAHEIPNEGGIVSWFTGDNDLDGFGKGLSKYGSYLTEYSNFMASVSKENVRKGTECFKMISEMSTKVSTGDIRLGTFCEDVRDLGEALVDYSNDASVVALKDTEIIIRNLNDVADACDNLASVDTNAIRKVGDSVQDSIRDVVDGCVEVILAKLPDYVKMGKDLITRINTGITNASPSMIATATKAGGDLIQAFRNAIGSKVSTVEQSFKNLTTSVGRILASVTSNFSSVGADWMSRLKSAVDSGKSFILISISGIEQSFKNLTTTVGRTLASVTSNFSSVGATWMSRLKSAVDSGKSSISSSISGMCGGLTNIIRSYYNSMYSAGATWMSKLKSGVDSGKSSVSSSISAVCGSLANTARGYYNSMYSAGYYLVCGLANGMSYNSYIASNAAASVARSAAQAARNALAIRSPSRVFEEIGKYVDQGLALGMTKNVGLIEDSSYNIAEKSIDIMKNTLSNVIDEEFDLDPVIRPVLDITDIQNGAGLLGSMFNNGLAISGSTRLAGAISRNPGSQTTQTSNISNNTNNTEIINHFNITGNNPQEIANEVSKIIQKQVERRGTVWA